MKQYLLISPHSAVFIIRWKVAGAFFSPNGFYYNNNVLVLNAIYFLDSEFIGIWWNPEDKLRAEKYFAFPSCERMSSMSGKISILVGQFIQFSKVYDYSPFLFPWSVCLFGYYTGELYGESEDSIIPLFNMSVICLLISSLWHSGGLYYFVFFECDRMFG